MTTVLLFYLFIFDQTWLHCTANYHSGAASFPGTTSPACQQQRNPTASPAHGYILEPLHRLTKVCLNALKQFYAETFFLCISVKTAGVYDSDMQGKLVAAPACGTARAWCEAPPTCSNCTEAAIILE